MGAGHCHPFSAGMFTVDQEVGYAAGAVGHSLTTGMGVVGDIQPPAEGEVEGEAGTCWEGEVSTGEEGGRGVT